MSPTQRTLKALRDEGWTAWVVERWNPYARIRIDVGGFGDILACHTERGIMIVQATSGSNVSSRINKIISIRDAVTWVRAGGLLQVRGWRKTGQRGKRKTWQQRIVNLIEDGGRLTES